MRPIPALLLGLLTACGGQTPPPGVQDGEARSISLFALDPSDLQIPADSRGGVAPPASLPLPGPWKYMGATKAGMHRWTTPIPIRPRGLFFHNAEPGISLHDRKGDPIPWGRAGKSNRPYWWHNRRIVQVFTPDKGSPPAAGDYVFAYPKATARELAMNFGMQPEGTQKIDFVRGSVHHNWNTRKGLLLPAPGTITWQVRIPASGELVMSPGLNRPELIDGPASDGADLIVSITAGGSTTEVERIPLEPGEFGHRTVNLSKWAGQDVELTLTSDPRATPNFDYVFVGEPVLASRKANPTRVVMVFVDTLRADHLGMYGYERETSIKLDRWAEGAAVFEQTRSVAPWTLPSGRAIVTGRHPEHYHSTASVQKVLADQGWRTAMIAGNVYLSTNFDMARDWGWHKVGMWPRAETITDDAIAWLQENEGHDGIIQVHYMDPHLPYLEPKAYRKLFAGEGEGGLGEEFHLPDVRRSPAMRGDEAVQQYVIDRYDNNVRYATDEVARLLTHLDDNDVVLVYADHGEEFWEHGGFEHGHQLHDELLRVPLIIDGPGIEGSRIADPTSVLDLTPTILEAVGVEDPEEERDGVSLWPTARGEADGALEGRELAFGRPLYGVERWGVLTEDLHKWMTHDGRQQAFDLKADPEEKRDLLRGKPVAQSVRYHQVLGEQLGTEGGVAYRIFGGSTRNAVHDVVVEVEVPGGVKHAWVEFDPIGRNFAEHPVVSAPDEDGNQVLTATWPHLGDVGQGTVWFVPNKPFAEVTHELRITASAGPELDVLRIPESRSPTLDGNVSWLTTNTVGGRQIRFGFGIGPVPRDDWKATDARDDEMQAMLEAAGYVEEDQEGPPDEE